MRQYYLAYAMHPNLQPLVGEISWSKHLVIMSRCNENGEVRKKIRNFACIYSLVNIALIVSSSKNS